MGEVRKQTKKDHLILANMSQNGKPQAGDMFISLPNSHFMAGIKWNISCHINKQRCHSYLRF